MPAPTNTTLATATDVGSLATPQTITQSAAFGGTTYDLWFSYTAVTGDTELGVFAYGSAVVYLATITFWLDVSTQYLFNDAQNKPTQIPIDPGTTYYWRVRPNGGNPTPATLTMLVQLGPTDQLTAGQIAINDSTSGYPVVVMNQSSAEPVSFVHPFASGEGVSVLLSGIVAAIDTTANGVKIYNPDLTLRVTPTMPATGYTECLATNQVDTFWVGKNSATSSIVAFDRDGTFDTPISLGAGALRTLAPNADGSLVYFARSISTANLDVLVVNTVSTVVSTFVAGVANYFFGANLLTLTDDTILVPYERVGFASIIKHYDAAATLLHTYTFAVNAGFERLFTDPSDPDYFWVWMQDGSAGTYTFSRVTVTSGAATTVGPHALFIEGDYNPAASATPTSYFGADFSCVPWIIRGTTATTTFPMRRLRRFLLPSSPDNKQMQMPTLELLMRTGIGLLPGDAADPPVLGSDPTVMIRLSKDGGKTWGPERWVSAGTIGKYANRVRLNRFSGNYRNAVVEVVVSDPVDWQMLAALAPNGVIEGSS